MPRGRPIASLSLSDLERLLDDRRNELTKLERSRTKLRRKLDAINRKITSLGGGAGAPTGSTRVRNDVSLADLINDILGAAGSPLAVGQIVEKVQAAGYQSRSSNFRSVVNITLIKDKRFVSESRGVYRLRGDQGSATTRETIGWRGGKGAASNPAHEGAAAGSAA
jgi:hypothetical protein